jgi:hypothetical protein
MAPARFWQKLPIGTPVDSLGNEMKIKVSGIFGAIILLVIFVCIASDFYTVASVVFRTILGWFGK